MLRSWTDPTRDAVAVGAVLSAGFGAFIGLIEIVPIIGPLIGSILVLAVGLLQSLHVAGLSLLGPCLRVPELHRQPHTGRTVRLSLVTLLLVAVVGSAVRRIGGYPRSPSDLGGCDLIDVLVFGHEPPTEQSRRSLRIRLSE
jgi:hypothetical protein